MDKSAFEYLHDRMEPFLEVPANGVASKLVAVPSGVNIESLEKFQKHPNAIGRDVTLCSSGSFCEYINRFGHEETTIYLDIDNGKFVSVLDHYGSKPAWCKHKATFGPKLSLEWNAWMSLHKEAINQVQLAHFIEERINDIQNPEPGDVLKAALEFQSNEKLVLGSHHNLDDGSVRFTFTKDNVRETVDFPHRIKIGIPIHENEKPVALQVRIRYRVDGDGALVFVMSLVRDPATILRDELLKLASYIRDEVAEAHVYEGRF